MIYAFVDILPTHVEKNWIWVWWDCIVQRHVVIVVSWIENEMLDGLTVKLRKTSVMTDTIFFVKTLSHFHLAPTRGN